MFLTLLCSIALVFASIEASTTSTPLTSTPRSKNFDELLDAFMVVEKNRQTVIRMAEEEAAKAESNVTLNFLKVVREADRIFENIRRYFDAGKVMFDKNKGKSKLNETDVHALTSTPPTSTLPTSTPPTSTPPTSSPPTSTPPSKSFDELLDACMVVGNDRKAAIKIAEEAAAAEAESNATLNFLRVVREADKALENLRRYLDAAKVDMNKGKLKLAEADLHVVIETELLRIKLSAMYVYIEAHMPDLPKGMYRVLWPIIELIKQSEHALNPLITKFRDDLEKTKPTSK